MIIVMISAGFDFLFNSGSILIISFRCMGTGMGIFLLCDRHFDKFQLMKVFIGSSQLNDCTGKLSFFYQKCF